MVFSAGQVPSGDTVAADVCIIGGGVAGLTLAVALAKAGRTVTLLESGGVEDDPSKLELSRGENAGEPYDQLTEGRHRRLGGCSHRWNIDLGNGARGPRLQPLRQIDLEERDWVPDSGWPYGLEELEDHYRESFRLLGLGEFDDEPANWSDHEHPLLPLDRERLETTLFRFIRRQIFSEELPRSLSASPGVRIFVDATVTELNCRPGTADVESVRVAAGKGHGFTVTARTFVLAAGALENARLLLSSTSGRPGGLGNERDLVGRYFMEHPHFCAGWLIPANRRLLERLSFYRLHRRRDYPVMAKVALSEDAIRRERLLGYCVGLRPIWRAVPGDGVRALLQLREKLRRGDVLGDLPADLLSVAGDFSGILRFGRDRLTERFVAQRRPNVVKLNAMTEQAPNRESRVTLSDQRDPLGQRRIRLEWRLCEQDLISVRRATAILGEEMRRAGLGTVVPNPDPGSEIVGGWHHMGTTRMHRDPRKGVVDENCKVHESSNLYLAGPSVFPTSGYANPILTVVALSLRLAGHLTSERAGVPLQLARA